METRKLAEILRATIDPNQRQEAEQQLCQVHKIIGFAPSLLQVVMMTDLDMPVRQAGVIYLKNLVTQNWADKEGDSREPLHFNVHEQDRGMIRDAIVDAVIHAPELIRVQLAVCVNHLVKHDFPGRWTQVVDKISIYLQNLDVVGWSGALLCLYQLVKNYEYKKTEERGPLTEAMKLLLPQTYSLILRLLVDPSEQSVLLQKQMLKIFFALTQYTLPMELLPKPVFTQWMEVILTILRNPVPTETQSVEEEERPELPWWKVKKWCLHILTRTFERYGSPGNVTKEYKAFSEWYLKTFSAGVLETLLLLLDQFRQHIYVSPRSLQLTLSYVQLAVSHAFSWKFLKQHMAAIIQDVLFPVMCHSQADQELWDCDPCEYIRSKFDMFEDYVSPVSAAQGVLVAACRKRKEMLPRTSAFLMSVLTTEGVDPKQKDGALHMIGSLADILIKKPTYKEQMEQMIITYVLPEFSSPHGHLRARACWTLHMLNEVQFRQEIALQEAVRLTLHALLRDQELPVKVEAAIALQSLLNGQEKAQTIVEPQVTDITLELLRIIRQTENDDLTTVLQRLVCLFTEQLSPIAVQMCEELAATFSQVVDSDEGTDEKAIAAMGILNTMETILAVLEEEPEVLSRVEPVILKVLMLIFSQAVMEFYEEAMALVYSLTTRNISPSMWSMLDCIHQVFKKDGMDYFTDMVPALHNYITVNTAAFLENENRLSTIFDMCKTVLSADVGEDPECHAAKLLEVTLLQLQEQAERIAPVFAEVALQRLRQEVKTSELRTMCLQVVVAALYACPNALLNALEQLGAASGAPPGTVAAHFVRQWIHDTDCFLGLHDRKVCVLGLCTLLDSPAHHLPVVSECANQVVPSLLLLFDGLQRAYAAKAQEGEEDSSEGTGEESDIENDVLSTDESDIDEEGNMYLEGLQRKINKSNHNQGEGGFHISTSLKDDDSDSDDDSVTEETLLEGYTTILDLETCPVDEYVVFRDLMARLEVTEPNWHAQLTSQLTQEQKDSLQEVYVLAEQRRAAALSKRIEQSGGYNFQQQTVPTTFNFGGAPLGR